MAVGDPDSDGDSVCVWETVCDAVPLSVSLVLAVPDAEGL